ncbi:hypothetical protein K432DRAFT_401918 [Lepidopterella palustris CBS 459.81]|uniref:EthD domain-containing protein n=1 Tax=Lepidopterella palustris CBS 459.81 TaxID=1314670 RepID=A0A8E2EGK0_9PEZI|nr:hypothetical protein K432DRAFT_401918 [Lepidopterella palustris CBS 459.81]
MAETTSAGVWLLAFITRREDLTHAEFAKYWKENHAKLVAPWLAKQGIITYRQFHIDPTTASQLGLDPSSDSIIKYDGVVQLQVESIEAWGKAVQDPYYMDVIVPDEQRFLQRKKIVMGIGELFGWVEGGKSLV